MKSIIPGFCYELASAEGTNDQVVQMICTSLVGAEVKLLKDGTTDSEVLEMLIDRATRAKEALDIPEAQEYLFHLRSSMEWLRRMKPVFEKLVLDATEID
ncbi:MAG: hypothetical protein ACO1RA_02225 [Planctomycetaceae bacterium]